MNQHRCPRCHHELDQGPILYWCGTCQRAVYAADLDTEYHPPAPALAA